MRPAFVSRLVLLGVCSAAAAGWFGLRLAPAPDRPAVSAAPVEAAAPVEPRQATAAPEAGIKPSDGTQLGVRNRAAWQPSPVPSQASQASQPDQRSASAAGTGEAPLPPLPALRSAPAMGGAAAMRGVLPVPGNERSSPSAGDYIPLSQQFTTDRLEALFDGGLPEQRGEWREERFYSQGLGKEVAYVAWVPPGYSTSNRAYPTLYLLHGVGGQNGFGVEEWLGYALTEDLDRMLAASLIEPMIVVLPNGEQSYWMNHADGGPRWGDFVAIDLVKHVDATFHTEPVSTKRAIGGLSMGGHGALQLALNHPDVFGIAGAHSPTLRPFETSPEFFGDQKWFAKNDPLLLVRNTDAALRIATWIDVGNQDEWRPAVEALRNAYHAKKAPLEFRVLEGEHEGWYWEYYLPEYLNFYSSALNATARTPRGAPAVVTRPLVTAGVLSPHG